MVARSWQASYTSASSDLPFHGNVKKNPERTSCATSFRYAMLVREMEREIGYDVIMYRIHAFPLCLYISSGCGIVSHDTAWHHMRFYEFTLFNWFSWFHYFADLDVCGKSLETLLKAVLHAARRAKFFMGAGCSASRRFEAPACRKDAWRNNILRKHMCLCIILSFNFKDFLV